MSDIEICLEMAFELREMRAGILEIMTRSMKDTMLEETKDKAQNPCSFIGSLCFLMDVR